jgi:hypothetical protein
MATTFDDKCNILGQLWMNHREDYGFKEFVEYNDLGLPLAFMISEGIVDNPTEAAHSFITEAFDIFIKALEIEDTGFSSLDEILDLVVEEE